MNIYQGILQRGRLLNLKIELLLVKGDEKLAQILIDKYQTIPDIEKVNKKSKKFNFSKVFSSAMELLQSKKNNIEGLPESAISPNDLLLLEALKD